MDGAPCKRSFDEFVEISNEYVSAQAVCFEGEDQIQGFKSMFSLAASVVESQSLVKWEDEGTLILTLRKADAPIYWDEIIKEPKNMQVGLWNHMHK